MGRDGRILGDMEVGGDPKPIEQAIEDGRTGSCPMYQPLALDGKGHYVPLQGELAHGIVGTPGLAAFLVVDPVRISEYCGEDETWGVGDVLDEDETIPVMGCRSRTSHATRDAWTS